MNNMNIAEYNRKMKGIDHDMERLAAEIETRYEKMRAAWAKRSALILCGWGE